MRTAFFDCVNGVSGDMFLSAAVDAGVDAEQLNHTFDSIFQGKVAVSFNRVMSGPISALQLDVTDHTEKKWKHYHDIVDMIKGSGLEEPVVSSALSIIDRLAEAEARVHGMEKARVHFHEIGAVDTLVDAVGAAVCMHHLNVNKGFSTPVAVGSGTVTCAHGELPLPAPATAEILKGARVVRKDINAECTTPTGAALIREFASDFGPSPAVVMETIGYGAGTRAPEKGRTNVFRMLIGSLATGPAADTVVIEANIDDMSPEQLAYAQQKLFAAGAQDVWHIPVNMKKGRSGFLLSVLTVQDKLQEISDVVFEQTSTFGLRWYPVCKKELDRDFVDVQTPYGTVRGKRALKDGRPVTISPEYEDCRKLAERGSVSLKEVFTSFYKSLHEFD